MKVTIYELLGFVKDGKAPKKILYKYCEYEFDEEENDYRNKDDLLLFKFLFSHEREALFFKVEIIEEKPKKVKQIEVDNSHIVDYDETGKHYLTTNRKDRNIYIKKINELTKAVNYLLEKSDEDE